MKVMKFGGSSVGTPETVNQVIEIVKNASESDKVVVVCSAFSKITDTLIKCGQLAKNKDEDYKQQLSILRTRHIHAFEALTDSDNKSKSLQELSDALNDIERICDGINMLQEFSERTQARLVSYGERLSCFIIAAAMRSKGLKATYVNASELVRTDNKYLGAKVDFTLTNNNIVTFVNSLQSIPIVTGFIGSDGHDITTLGRGGSDYTAAIFGAALQADVIEIWTDVDGVLTADPRRVEQSFTIPSLTYKEAMELSHFGAKVIYPPTIIPALQKNIPIKIKNTFNPTHNGSLISKNAQHNNNDIKGISSISDITVLRLEGSGMIGVVGITARLFGALSKSQVNIIFLTQGSSEQSICFGIMPHDTDIAVRAVNEEFKSEMESTFINPIVVERKQSVIAVVGENMMNVPGVSAKVFKALGKNGINVKAIAQGSSELNITIIIDTFNEAKALNSLHEIFFESDYKSINVFLVGPSGLIGNTLLQQIKYQRNYLSNEKHIEINITGVINTRKMLIESNGLEIDTLEGSLEKRGLTSNINTFIQNMITLNFANSVFIDCSASKEICNHYEEILKKSISVITPNKIANTLGTVKYKTLREAANRSNAKFLYETNVGAGLPVINTLTNLLDSGDKILKIEAVLSGTLSYIFNSYKGEKKFSDVVLEAKEKGYTEPDPRDDLSGLDVARKALILSREIGIEMELDEISVQNLVPANLQTVSVDEFLARLDEINNSYELLKDQAMSQNKVLRYMAVIEAGNVSISLLSVDGSHPFYNLTGSDNMIVFTTERYKNNPLVIKGPGAGAEVTAAGVFAELISLGNYYAN
jgi:aspartokinase/homoserine dehydrogenase 1